MLREGSYYCDAVTGMTSSFPFFCVLVLRIFFLRDNRFRQLLILCRGNSFVQLGHHFPHPVVLYRTCGRRKLFERLWSNSYSDTCFSDDGANIIVRVDGGTRVSVGHSLSNIFMSCQLQIFGEYRI